jgi:hypothetical protein
VVATAAAPYGLLLLAGCGFGTYLADRVGQDGLGALGHGVLLPTTLMLVLLLVGAGAGVLSVVRQLSATRRLGEHVDRKRAVAPFGTPAGVEVVDDDEPFAFTFGIGQPRVALSRGLVDQLSPEELEAVVLHERYHVRARDPLKLVVARAAARTCFFLPAVGHLVARYLAGRELAADRRAVRDLGRPALAGALFKVVGGPAWDELDTAAAMAGPELLAVRVDQLEQGTEPALPRLPVVSIALSALVLATLGGIVTAVALQGGLSMMSSGRDDALSAGDLAGAIAGGLACMVGWVWLARIALRRLGRSLLTTTDA